MDHYKEEYAIIAIRAVEALENMSTPMSYDIDTEVNGKITVLGVDQGLCEIAQAINNLAHAVRGLTDGSR